jgi:hypothetical protein
LVYQDDGEFDCQMDNKHPIHHWIAKRVATLSSKIYFRKTETSVLKFAISLSMISIFQPLFPIVNR